MLILFNLFYLAGFVIGLPWIVISRIFSQKSFRSWPVKFLGRVPKRKTDKRCAWFHAVSVGEVNLLATVVDRFRHQNPDIEVVISTTTDTGFQLAQTKFKDLCVFYCPWDFSWSLKAAFQRIRPDLLVLAELEIWPNLIRVAKSQSVEVAVINGRLSEKSLRGYRKFRWLSKTIFGQLDLVAAQNETYAHRFRELGTSAAKIHVTGSVKFDGASTQRNTEAIERLKIIADIKGEQTIFLAGSTQQGEDEIAVQAFVAARHNAPQLRLMIAPRHPHRASAIAKMVSATNLSPVFRSELGGGNGNSNSELTSNDVMIIDTIGELADWWGTADIAFVGGSLGNRGGQNMLEPAAKGCAVCFGPNTKNFRDIVEMLLECDSAKVVTNENEMAAFLNWVMSNTQKAGLMASRATQLVESQTGATGRTLELLNQLIHSRAPSRRRAA